MEYDQGTNRKSTLSAPRNLVERPTVFMKTQETMCGDDWYDTPSNPMSYRAVTAHRQHKQDCCPEGDYPGYGTEWCAPGYPVVHGVVYWRPGPLLSAQGLPVHLAQKRSGGTVHSERGIKRDLAHRE